MRASASSSSSSLSPWRSVPNASTARGSSAPASSRLAVGVERQQRPLDRREVRQATEPHTGSAKCRPAAPRSASGCHGSWLPCGQDPSASAAARHAHAGAHVAQVARVLQQDDRRGSLRRRAQPRGRPGPLRERHHAGRRRERCELIEDSRGSTAARARAIRSPTSGASSEASRSSSLRVVVSTSSSVAPKRSACLSGWKPSRTASDGSRRARPKRGMSEPSCTRR